MLTGSEVVAGAKLVNDNLTRIEKIVRWFKNQRFPKAPNNSIGFAIGLYVEDPSHQRQVENDFIETIRERLEQLQPSRPIKLVPIPPHHARKIKTIQEAERVLDKCNCMFLVWGLARYRNINGTSHFVIDLKSMVKHGFVDSNVSATLAVEMSELLPPRRAVSQSNDLSEFEVNAASVELAALYIIGVAALISGDPSYSLEVFENLQARLANTDETGFPPQIKGSITLLRIKTVINLGVIHLELARQCQLKWRDTRDFSYLENMYAQTVESDKYIKNSYNAAVLRALYYFVRDRNTKLARKEISKWKGQGDATWAFDEAFLYAYDGKLKDALRNYKIAFKKRTDSRALNEIEEFLEWVLSEEPNKHQLYFCLGIINYFGKGDLKTAKVDFERFINATADSNKFENERSLAKSYISEIDAKQSRA